jgi:preprotein translocase subunit SecG
MSPGLPILIVVTCAVLCGLVLVLLSSQSFNASCFSGGE